MTDTSGSTPSAPQTSSPAWFSEKTKNMIITGISSMLLGGACATLGAKLGLSHDQMVAFADAAAPVIFAALVAIGTFIYNLLPKSKASILKGATEVPGVKGILTDPATAHIGSLADNDKVVSSVLQLKS